MQKQWLYEVKWETFDETRRGTEFYVRDYPWEYNNMLEGIKDDMAEGRYGIQGIKLVSIKELNHEIKK